MTNLGSSIKIRLVDGSPKGLRIATKSNWIGRAVMAARSDYPRLRKGLPKESVSLRCPGVYILIGPPDDGIKDRIYIGETNDLVTRLDQHSKLDFWTDLVVCNACDDSLNKADIEYLEGRLIRLASDAGIAKLDNGNIGTQGKLSKADEDDAETFLEKLLVLLPVLGLRYFDVVDKPPNPELSTLSTSEEQELLLEGKDAKGRGYDRADGFLVLKGSQARAKMTSAAGKANVQLRQVLQADGSLAPDGARLTLTRSIRFNSPSQAASVLLGHAANGRTTWRDSTGRTLAEIQISAIQDEAAPSSDLGAVGEDKS